MPASASRCLGNSPPTTAAESSWHRGMRSAVRTQSRASRSPFPAGRGSVQLVVMDVSDDASVAEAADKVKQMLGGDMLYGVVNNAGK